MNEKNPVIHQEPTMGRRNARMRPKPSPASLLHSTFRPALDAVNFIPAIDNLEPEWGREYCWKVCVPGSIEMHLGNDRRRRRMFGNRSDPATVQILHGSICRGWMVHLLVMLVHPAGVQHQQKCRPAGSHFKKPVKSGFSQAWQGIRGSPLYIGQSQHS